MKKIGVSIISIYLIFIGVLGIIAAWQTFMSDRLTSLIDLLLWGILLLLDSVLLIINIRPFFSKVSIETTITFNKYFMVFQILKFKVFGMSYIFSNGIEFIVYFMDELQIQIGYQFESFP
jgi:hypothetical protein